MASKGPDSGQDDSGTTGVLSQYRMAVVQFLAIATCVIFSWLFGLFTPLQFDAMVAVVAVLKGIDIAVTYMLARNYPQTLEDEGNPMVRLAWRRLGLRNGTVLLGAATLVFCTFWAGSIHETILGYDARYILLAIFIAPTVLNLWTFRELSTGSFEE